jgi:hypothetical protein
VTNADIFFLVTTVVVIIIGAALATALYYLIKILREVKEVSRAVYHDSLLALREVEELGARGKIFPVIAKSIVGALAGKIKKRKRRSKS